MPDETSGARPSGCRARPRRRRASAPRPGLWRAKPPPSPGAPSIGRRERSPPASGSMGVSSWTSVGDARRRLGRSPRASLPKAALRDAADDRRRKRVRPAGASALGRSPPCANEGLARLPTPVSAGVSPRAKPGDRLRHRHADVASHPLHRLDHDPARRASQHREPAPACLGKKAAVSAGTREPETGLKNGTARDGLIGWLK